MTITLTEIANALDNLADMMVSDRTTDLVGYNASFWRDAAAIARVDGDRLEQLETFIFGNKEEFVADPTGYYQIHAAIIQAAAVLAVGMPPPSDSQKLATPDGKNRLMFAYQERYHMAYKAIALVAASEMEGFPHSPPEEESEL